MKPLAQHLLLAAAVIFSLTLCDARAHPSQDEPPPPAAEYNQSVWTDFSPPDNSFKISMPGKPASTVQQLKTRAGLVPQQVYYLKSANVEYAVSTLDLPVGSYDAQAVRKMLDAGRDNMLAQDKEMKVLSEREIKVEGYDGREMLLDDADAILMSRAFIVGTRVYNITLSMPPGSVFTTGRPSALPADRTDFFETTAGRFFGSFKLTSGPSSPPAAMQHDQNSWKEFSSTEGNFKVMMPGTPTAQTQETPTDLGVITMHINQLQTSTAAYFVIYADFPAQVENPTGVKRVLDGARDSMLSEGKNNMLLSETEVVLDGETGREWLVADGDVIIRARAFFIKGRLYQVILGTKRSLAFKAGQPGRSPQDRTEFYEATTAKFFDSFKLLPASREGLNQQESGEVDRYLQDNRGTVYGILNSNGGEYSSSDTPRLPLKGGVLNAKALNLPSPDYPAIARAAHASGTVTVQVVIDEEGKVVAAQARGGHPLLFGVSVKAARAARFPPTTLNGKPVKITGLITYNFVPTR